jgi:hypothetical protein
VPKFGGEKALTKQLHDEALKSHLTLEDAKITVIPKMIDNSIIINAKNIHPQGKVQVKMTKPKVATVKRSRLDRITQNLYDLECGNEPEKKLNIDLDLYQMEDY